jgi:hypothetical protein
VKSIVLPIVLYQRTHHRVAGGECRESDRGCCKLLRQSVKKEGFCDHFPSPNNHPFWHSDFDKLLCGDDPGFAEPFAQP